MTTFLLDALQLHTARSIAFVGAGGKTTAIWRISDELLSLNRCAIISPTTHILEPTLTSNSILYLAHSPQPDQLISLLNLAPRLILAAERAEIVDFDIANEFPPARSIKLKGLDSHVVATLVANTPTLVGATFLIEADGARRHPLKAPAQHEPPIPENVEVVVIVASLDAIDHPLTESTVHRSEIFAQLSQTKLGDSITPEMIARVILHEQGGLKNIPLNSRICMLLTQHHADKPHPSANSLANLLLASSRIDRVVVASLHAQNPIVAAPFIPPPSSLRPHTAAIILAAGESTRFGDQPKQLADWQGRSFVQIATDNALEAGLDPVIVIIGSHADKVRSNLGERTVICVENKNWQHGQSTSVKVGLQALPENVKAALFMPIDQPNLTPQILRDIIHAYHSTHQPIVTASVNGKRTTPVLFDRSMFDAIRSVEGDRGPRALIDQNPDRVARVEIDAESAIDIDTFQDYARLLKKS